MGTDGDSYRGAGAGQQKAVPKDDDDNDVRRKTRCIGIEPACLPIREEIENCRGRKERSQLSPYPRSCMCVYKSPTKHVYLYTHSNTESINYPGMQLITSGLHCQYSKEEQEKVFVEGLFAISLNLLLLLRLSFLRGAVITLLRVQEGRI